MGGVETSGGDGSETGSVMEEGGKIDDQNQFQPNPDFMDKEESNNIYFRF